MNQVKKINFWVILLHFLTIYIPVYKFVDIAYVKPVSIRILDLNAGTYFGLYLFIVFIVHTYAIYFRTSLLKIMRYVSLVSMLALIGLSFLGKEAVMEWGNSIYLQILFTAFFATLIFAEDYAVKVVNTLDKLRLRIASLLTVSEKPEVSEPVIEEGIPVEEEEIIEEEKGE